MTKPPHPGRNLAIFWLVVVGIPLVAVASCVAAFSGFNNP